MMQLPTGAGKTDIAAAFLSKYLAGGRKAVWLTHRKELASQTESRLFQSGVSATQNVRWTPGARAPRIANGTVILMAQTVGRRTINIADDVWGDYDRDDLMIIDEAHHAVAKGWERAMRQWPGRVLGMTATPWRLSRKEGFDHLFGELIPGPQIRDLQAQRFLCPAQVVLPDEENRIAGGNIGSTGDYTETGIEAANDSGGVLTALAIKFWQEYAADRQTIMYAVSVAHADNLAALLQEQGIPAAAIHARTDAPARAQAIDSFSHGRLRVLINVAIATEGFDLPDASCVVIARPTKSLSLYLQMVGRGLRPKEQGGNCLILDLAGNALEHGLPEDDREWSLTARGEADEGEPPVVMCNECQSASPAGSHLCGHCSAPFGEDCPRCGKWRAFSHWSLDGKCGFSHERVCNLCHKDAHQQADLPAIPGIYAFEYTGEETAANGNGSYALEDPAILDPALVTALEEIGGEGKVKDVIRRTAEILYEIEGRRHGVITRGTELEHDGLSSVDAQEERIVAMREHMLSHSSETERQLLISHYRLADFSDTDVQSAIRQAYKRLERAGRCDPNAGWGVWRLNGNGHGPGKDVFLHTPDRGLADTIRADTIILNANVITMDPASPSAGAIAIKDGRFLAVGADEDLAPFRNSATEILDAEGGTVLPGFIDAHTHVMSSGLRHVAEEDCDLRSIGEIQEALKVRTVTTASGEWVRGFKFDDTKTSEQRFLHRRDLDAVSCEHPIMVAHQAGHVYFFNSLGLRRAGFSDDTPDPHGGRLGRDTETGKLNGRVYGAAIYPVLQKVLPRHTDEDRRSGLDLICRMFAEAGLTSVHDAMVSIDDLRVYQQARDEGDLPLRVYLLMYRDHFPALRDAGIRSGLGDERLRIGGIKMVADGAIATRTAYLSQPYVGSCCDHGLAVMDAEETEHRVLEAHKAGFQVCIHSNGDEAIDMVVTAYEKAQEAFPRKDPRHRIEHCSVVNPDLLRRIKAAGCVVTPFCSYVYYHGEKMRFYGEERLKWMFAQRSFIDHGINSTGAADYPCSPLPPLMGIQSCVTREDYNGQVWGPEQRITVEEALKLYTINGAYASFEEDLKGSIEPGKLADLVILGDDPRTVNPRSIMDIPVLRTIVGGETVYQRD